MTVEEFINEFDMLRMRCDVVEEEKQVVARFLGVLMPEIADIVSLQPYWTYTDVCQLALKVEKQIKENNKGSTSRFTPPTKIISPIAPKTSPKATTPTTSTVGLRNNIFRTKCTSKQRIFDMIIHGGSCENVVSTYMVEKLGLKTEEPPKPYQLTWLKKGTLLNSVTLSCAVFY
nr:reverse transcriptase domain-containing protein [Tanacetum cinerariifolium]